MKATAREKRGAKMTLRVYRVDADGAVVEDRGTVSVTDRTGPPPLHSGFPPCACPRHRDEQAEDR
ncbi:hypothetical protein [Streptomyces sp. NPDC006134]|uniref:hypothetical protein n=1 Tax=Streptomyces sp. NPDC006134 TaxID=3154467 RepID=UPI0033C7D339